LRRELTGKIISFNNCRQAVVERNDLSRESTTAVRQLLKEMIFPVYDLYGIEREKHLLVMNIC